MKLGIGKTLAKVASNAAAKSRKYSPEILIVAGVVGMGVAVYLACNATAKALGIKQKHDEVDEQIKSVSENKALAAKNNYTEEDAKNDYKINKIQRWKDYILAYAPTVLAFIGSAAAIFGGSRIFRIRNTALSSACAIAMSKLSEYRERVKAFVGEDDEKKLYNNAHVEKIEETTAKGKTKTKEVTVVEEPKFSSFARFFDDGCKGWTKDPELNLMYLKRIQDHCNELVKSRAARNANGFGKGAMVLNEVYRMLGIPETKAGCVVGWIYDINGNDQGDNFIDFGIYNTKYEPSRDFVNGYENVILLDFNVDGPIDDRI